MLRNLAIRLKLLLLAGVPVVGALILAVLLARGARREAATAEALGSIEDLARLSAQMSTLVHEVGTERNASALALASETPDAAALDRVAKQSDLAYQGLSGFLRARRMTALPPRLARDLNEAQQKFASIGEIRSKVREKQTGIVEVLDYYNAINHSLVSATAALAQLSDDGEMMRIISSLVGVLQLQETESKEHALLSHVFAAKTFPPGIYKELVTLVTEQHDHVAQLELAASDNAAARFRSLRRGPEFERAIALRKLALDTLDDDFKVEASEWVRVREDGLDRLRSLEIELNREVAARAVAKLEAARRQLRLSYGIGGSIILFSLLLATLIGRGIHRSIGNLASAAQRVRSEKDFSVRAVKLSDDELGSLTEVFNEMLSGIQERDSELSEHRQNLERLVEVRTRELQRRNESMRMVLDNVEQGLATIQPNAVLASERSRAFDAWFCPDPERAPSDSGLECIAKGNPDIEAALRLGWEQIQDGLLPLEVALDQMPKQIAVQGRHYALNYRPITEQDKLIGVLLVVSDITDDLLRARREAEQRELIAVFERVMRDRSGFIEFFQECESLVEQVVHGRINDVSHVMRAVHTVKGNCALFGVTSVAEVAHELESDMTERGSMPSADQIKRLGEAWQALSDRVRRLSGEEAEPILEIAHEELGQLVDAAKQRVPHERLIALLERLKYERAVVRLRRSAEQAQALAKRLDKGDLKVEINAGDVRLPAERWASFWAAFVHVIRNAVDHGIEPIAEREATGKPPYGTLRLSTSSNGRELFIELHDDGRGIDWDRVRERAKERGIPHANDGDLAQALFEDGLSTAQRVTDVSGRGVGLGAVRDVTSALGGSIAVLSKRGEGTTFRFTFPLSLALKSNPSSRYPGARPSLTFPNSERGVN
ncbi:MAG TPA: nitrate- and nitrite sensing domain-containing protein [Polyangiaceae bacterium]|nr:nitrate- and nitrite sensing domain-containing protein [Polyangiaceae bacterium]